MKSGIWEESPNSLNTSASESPAPNLFSSGNNSPYSPMIGLTPTKIRGSVSPKRPHSIVRQAQAQAHMNQNNLHMQGQRGGVASMESTTPGNNTEAAGSQSAVKFSAMMWEDESETSTNASASPLFTSVLTPPARADRSDDDIIISTAKKNGVWEDNDDASSVSNLSTTDNSPYVHTPSRQDIFSGASPIASPVPTIQDDLN